jgi:hypothetical protein
VAVVLGLILIVIVGLSPLAGRAIARSIKGRRVQPDTRHADERQFSYRTMVLVIAATVIVSAVVDAVLSPLAAAVVFFALGILALGFVIAQVRRSRPDGSRTSTS